MNSPTILRENAHTNKLGLADAQSSISTSDRALEFTGHQGRSLAAKTS